MICVEKSSRISNLPSVRQRLAAVAETLKPMRKNLAAVRQLLDVQQKRKLHKDEQQYLPKLLRSEFYLELIDAAPAVLDLFIDADDARAAKLGELLANMATKYSEWTQAAMKKDGGVDQRRHGGAAAWHMRRAPLLHEASRPLVLRWLLKTGAAAVANFARLPIEELPIPPPQTMGPPKSAPRGVPALPPLELPPPVARAGATKKAWKPTAVGPPSGAPRGVAASPPAKTPAPEAPRRRPDESITTFCRLMRAL